MKKISLGVFALATSAGLALAACDSADRTDRTVGQKIDSAVARTQQKLAAAGDKIAQQTDRAVSADARPMSDTAITASIKTDYLKDPDLSVLKIDVDTRAGVVTLNGLAENEEARQRAAKIAESVKGVKEIRNYLVLKRV